MEHYYGKSSLCPLKILQMYFGVPWVSGTIHTETKHYPINIEIEHYNIRLHDAFNELNET